MEDQVVYLFTAAVFCIGMFFVFREEKEFTEIEVEVKIKKVVNRDVNTKLYYFYGVEANNADNLVQTLRHPLNIYSEWSVDGFQYTFHKVKRMGVPAHNIKIPELDINIPSSCVNFYVKQ